MTFSQKRLTFASDSLSVAASATRTWRPTSPAVRKTALLSLVNCHSGVLVCGKLQRTAPHDIRYVAARDIKRLLGGLGGVRVGPRLLPRGALGAARGARDPWAARRTAQVPSGQPPREFRFVFSGHYCAHTRSTAPTPCLTASVRDGVRDALAPLRINFHLTSCTLCTAARRVAGPYGTRQARGRAPVSAREGILRDLP